MRTITGPKGRHAISRNCFGQKVDERKFGSRIISQVGKGGLPPHFEWPDCLRKKKERGQATLPNLREFSDVRFQPGPFVQKQPRTKVVVARS